MPVWTELEEFEVSDFFDDEDLNNIINNILFLREPPRYFYQRGFADGDYTTTSTTFVDIDATNMAATITTYGNDVLVRWSGALISSGSGNDVFFELLVDGVEVSNDVTYGLGGFTELATAAKNRLSFEVVVPNLAAGSHEFVLQWRTNTGTLTMPDENVIQFEVREL